MKSYFAKNPQMGVLLFVTMVVATLSSPFWLWQMKPEKKLDILIVDKTVPDQSYREHKGLTWILNNEKYRKADGGNYSADNDYVGFKPKAQESYSTKDLPKQLEKYKVIYLADLYGVYEDEFYRSRADDEKSSLLYGGLLQEDINRLKAGLEKGGKTLIAEFNTFGSPTEESVSKQMTDILNIEWSGWTGRYFADLAGTEVPSWITDEYSSQSGPWSFTGKGFVFVNKKNRIIVLNEEELSGKGLDFILTDRGNRFFEKELDSQYRYWFDIIQPKNEHEVLAFYSIPASQDGLEQLAQYGIPATFPAVVHHENDHYSSYYFAGDFADEAEVPGIYQTVGMTSWRKAALADKSFYWSTYVPMLKEILEDVR
ncbi:hypothetical protein [Mesobacillus subterraneus]|uniref:Uncharacterized protein n=1 Tax=Mesobacillus subterraneus TaxID=285983 RepID=A0A427TYJ0_9BACI|nr:hypothetical protein [Mesobacillus subterraneus]RSD29195.1 hypothetical protein EJA10_00650 [Mesobacillus subterraneus]